MDIVNEIRVSAGCDSSLGLGTSYPVVLVLPLPIVSTLSVEYYCFHAAFPFMSRK